MRMLGRPRKLIVVANFFFSVCSHLFGSLSASRYSGRASPCQAPSAKGPHKVRNKFARLSRLLVYKLIVHSFELVFQHKGNNHITTCDKDAKMLVGSELMPASDCPCFGDRFWEGVTAAVSRRRSGGYLWLREEPAEPCLS